MREETVPADTQPITGVVSPVVIAAHELKSPLALIRQLTLELQQLDLTDKERQQLLEQILLTSERSLELTSGLTRAARLEDSLFSSEALNVAAVCEQTVHELTPLYRAHHKTIEVQKRHTPLMAVANRELLRRIIRQFADNALHYGDDTHPVVISARQIDQQVRINVRDYGPAMTTHSWRSIGQSLQPLHARPESSGLGLMIARQFAESMHGRIGVTRHQSGASFYVDLLRSQQLSLV